MWRPNQLSIYLKMNELLNQSIGKSIQDNPYLKTWVNPEDMRRDVRSGLPSRNLNATSWRLRFDERSSHTTGR
jgi:hypothetical protein